MAKMPELVELHDTYPDDRLVVIGINFDDDVERARAAIEKHGLRWPQVHAKSAARGSDDLWDRISNVEALPRAFLVDRDGVLRLDFRPTELAEKVGPFVEKD